MRPNILIAECKTNWEWNVESNISGRNLLLPYSIITSYIDRILQFKE